MAKILENLCKTPCKSTRKTCAYFRANLTKAQNPVYKIHFPPAFPSLSTKLHTTISPLYLTNLFHYSTDPTITTINNLIERI